MFKYILQPIFDKTFGDYRNYLIKKNLDNIILYCSFIAVFMMINIAFDIHNAHLIHMISMLFVVYFVIIAFSIYIQKKKYDQLVYFVIPCLIFLFGTMFWLVYMLLHARTVLEFYYFYIVFFLILSTFITIFPIMHVGITLAITSVASYYFLNHTGIETYHWLILVALTVYTLINNFIGFTNNINAFFLNKNMTHKNMLLLNLSQKDTLTNLYTNKYTFEQLEYEIERSNRYNLPLSTMFIDIDDFNAITETYGQVFGDDVLTTVANIIQSMTRSTDIACRYSGKKFLVILPNSSLEESIIVAERIRVTTANNDFTVSDKITVSIGLKSYNKTTTDTYIKGVELLMHEAKLNGKNRVQY